MEDWDEGVLVDRLAKETAESGPKEEPDAPADANHRKPVGRRRLFLWSSSKEEPFF